jgi:IS30 family transposase
MDKYNQITEEEQCHILANKKVGFIIPQIAEELGHNKSTIYRELECNVSDICYLP